MLGFFTAPSIVWGPGAIEQLSALGAKEVLLVVDREVHRHGGERRTEEELAKTGTHVVRFSEVEVEPTLASVERARASIGSLAPDWIVAVGGGSTIDTAKALWIRLARPEIALAEVSPLLELGLRRRIRFAALPTTGGSGSEATWSIHLADEGGRPLEIASRELVPDWAILDPGPSGTLPARPTAESAADAVAHAFEAIASEWSNPFADAAARQALAILVPLLPKVVRRGDDPGLRGEAQIAATLAGLAVSNAQYGVAHALAHALGAALHRPHAALVAALLPYAVEFNFPVARDRFQPLGSLLGPSSVQSRGALAERLRQLWRSVDLPLTLGAAGVDADALARVRDRVLAEAHRSPGAVANPRVPSPEELGRLLDVARTGAPVDF